MKPSVIAGVAALLLALTGCASSGGRVSTMVEPGFEARPGQTWAWQPVAPSARPGADPRVDNDIVRGALERAIRTAMASRGFMEARDPARADLLLAFRVGLTRRTEQRQTPEPAMVRQRVVCGARGCVPVLDTWGWFGPPTPSVRTVEYLEGGVMLDVVDAASGRLGWRGTIEDRIHRDGLPPQDRIDAAMVTLLAKLPVDGR